MNNKLFDVIENATDYEDYRFVSPPPIRSDLRVYFPDLPFVRSCRRLIDICNCRGIVSRNDSPTTDWYRWIHTEVHHLWETFERKSMDDVFLWTQNDTYRTIQKMRKQEKTGASRTAMVSILKGQMICQKCRRKPGEYGLDEATTDHIDPDSLGGADHIDNYQVMCSRCNPSKGNRRKY